MGLDSMWLRLPAIFYKQVQCTVFKTEFDHVYKYVWWLKKLGFARPRSVCCDARNDLWGTIAVSLWNDLKWTEIIWNMMKYTFNLWFILSLYHIFLAIFSHRPWQARPMKALWCTRSTAWLGTAAPPRWVRWPHPFCWALALAPRNGGDPPMRSGQRAPTFCWLWLSISMYIIYTNIQHSLPIAHQEISHMIYTWYTPNIYVDLFVYTDVCFVISKFCIFFSTLLAAAGGEQQPVGLRNHCFQQPHSSVEVSTWKTVHWTVLLKWFSCEQFGKQFC